MKSVMLLNQDPWRLHLQQVASYIHLTKSYFPEDWVNTFLGTLRAGKASHILRSLAALPVTEYGDPMEYGIRSQLVAYFKKYDFSAMNDVVEAFKPGQVAWKKFQASEHRCKRVNSRFLALRIRARNVGFDDRDTSRRLFRYYSLLEESRRYILKVLGEDPPLDKIYSMCDFGPGASVGNPRSRGTNLGRKLLGLRWSVSNTALSYAIPALFSNIHLRELILSPEGKIFCHDYEEFSSMVKKRVAFVEHNNIAFVPKSYKTMRSVAVEPLLNGFVQKGIDQFMRHRLLSYGTDLRDQFANNELARIGSITGEYSTIDLSSASDSISCELVKHLLPPSWFELLDAVRSRHYSYDGVVRRYSKFCSMGNGFCFPLQTLIFKSLVHAVGRYTKSRDRHCVYGDDIIVNKGDSLLLLELLSFCGFTANRDKTFITGRFRESCGTDWYAGQDVRPVYFTHIRTNIDAFISHNISYEWFLYPLLEDHRLLARRYVPEKVRFMRPFHGSPDTAFSVERDVFMASPFAEWRKMTYSWRWRELVFRSISDRLEDIDRPIHSKEFVKYLAILRGSHSSSALSRSGSTPRARVRWLSYWGREVNPSRHWRNLAKARL